MSFVEELMRRNVARVAAAYVVTSWLIVQVADSLLPPFGYEYATRYIIIALALAALSH